MKIKAIQELLQQLLDVTHCSEAILCTRAGSVVGYSRLELNAPHAVASVAAGLATAVAKLSFLLGEPEVDLILQRGIQRCIALSGMPGDMVLVTVHGSEEREERIREIADRLAFKLLELQPRSRSGIEGMPEELLLKAHSVLNGIFSKAA